MDSGGEPRDEPAKSIFLDALEIPSPADRLAYLDRRCGHDAALRAEVETLLRHHEGLGDYLERPALAPAATREAAARPTVEGPGAIIGRYKLLEPIGEGGMGAVYMAEQAAPVKRMVALKVIKPGMDSRQVLARFDAERQALALMDHPNIAKVLDAGATGQGRSYFVMELVKGVPITQFCDERRLTPRERLELFIPVCQAVQHAHQKGIIHRDLKPTNVLVGLYDGKPVPKIIDFGVAKAMSQKLTEQTLFTGLGTVVGTPEYMSPEQAQIDNIDIDTRSDIYSLGILLYELLTGTTPLQHRRMKHTSVLEMLRLVREEEPPRPSRRLSTAEDLPSIAANRKLEPRKLTGLVHGDLDWIVMKALDKDRNRRYETANDFAADVQRHLNDEPVLACPPSALYRSRKWVWRNKGLVLGGALILLTLVLGVIGTSIGLWYANEARRKAVAAERRADDRRREAEDQTALANAVKEFLKIDVLQLADPATQPLDAKLDYNADMRLRDVVLWAAERIEGRFVDQPLVEAEIRHTLGVTLLNMGRADLAIGQLERVRQLRAHHLGPDHPDTLTAMTDLAGSYADVGRHDEALKLREETLARRIRKLGPDHPDTLTSMSNLTISYRVLGRNAEALRVREETLALRTRKLGPDHLDTIWSMNNLANSYADVGRHDEALKLREHVLALRSRKLGPDHPDTLLSISYLALSYARLGRHDEALKLREHVLALRNRKLGPDHPDTLWAMTDLAASYADVGRHDEALKLREETLARRKQKLGPDHIHTLTSMNNLALSYARLGRHDEALKLREHVLALRNRKLGPDHPDTLRSAEAVIHSLLDLKRPDEALPRIDELSGAAAKAAQSGKHVDPGLIPKLFDFRMRIHRDKHDSGGCRATAQMWERLNPCDAGSMYDAARFWAIAAAAQADGPAPESARLANEDADKAMAWLTSALAAGFTDRAHGNDDTDLDFIRKREDFRRLMIGTEARTNSREGRAQESDPYVK